MIAVPGVISEGMTVVPVAHDELVYISADLDRIRQPITAAKLATANLVMPDSTFRAEDSTRIVLRTLLHETDPNPHTRTEAEDAEPSAELVGMGLDDTALPQVPAAHLP